jgi:hypothetical protein
MGGGGCGVGKQEEFVIYVFKNVWMFAVALLLLSGVEESCHRRGKFCKWWRNYGGCNRG